MKTQIDTYRLLAAISAILSDRYSKQITARVKDEKSGKDNNSDSNAVDYGGRFSA